MEKLTLDNLQEWIDSVSPISINLREQKAYVISKVSPGIAGKVRIIYETETEITCLSTWDVNYKKKEVEIRYGYIDYSDLIKPIRIEDKRWFSFQEGV